MSINLTNILLRNNYVPVPSSDGTANREALATVLMDLSYYGYALDQRAYASLTKLDDKQIVSFWAEVEKELKDITGDSRNIDKFVVYKNFPAEVLSKTEAEYWIPQILMYWGYPAEFFTEPVKAREDMTERKKEKVLSLASERTPDAILDGLLRLTARWKDTEAADALFLAFRPDSKAQFQNFGFKENLIQLASHFIQNNRPAAVSTATDVLRLAAGLSNGDISLREKTKFISFKKPARRFLLSSLETCEHMEEDFARRPEMFKRLIHQLHPGDKKNKYPRVIAAMDKLYKGELETFNSKVESLLSSKSEDALSLLASRPGEFRRRLAQTLAIFGDKAAYSFAETKVLNKLTTAQVVSLRKHLDTVNGRGFRVFPPKGNWNKVKVETNTKTVDAKRAEYISGELGKVLANRLPKVKVLSPDTKRVKLPTNAEAGPYTRGTSFPIPENIKFIRTASYWQNNRHCYFDNGWNFFGENWGDVGSCSWTQVNFRDGAAVFSGDPVNSKEMKGRAAQLIDLYPEKLKKAGVRYAVWSILCYSHIPFGDASDVFAALQWGENAEKGKLFEPSRAQLAFPLTGNQMTKYIALIDLEKMEMVYLDANLKGAVHSASDNGKVLSETMPAFMEYISAIPSVHDLFAESLDEEKGEGYVLYSDADVKIPDANDTAYVFRPENKENIYKRLSLESLL